MLKHFRAKSHMLIQVKGHKLYFTVLPTNTCVADEMPHSILLHNSEDLLNFPTLAGIIKLTSDKVHIDERQEF